MYIFAYHFSSIDRGHVTDYTNLHIYFKFTYIRMRLFCVNQFFFVLQIHAKWQILLLDHEKWIKFVFNKLDSLGTSPKYDVLILIKLCRFIASIFLLSTIVHDFETENLLFLEFRENLFCWISWKLLQTEHLYR